MVDIIGAFAIALGVLADPFNVLLLLVGTATGVLIGMLPGLGSVVALALFIPITFGMDPLVAFMFLVAINGGVSQGGSVSAILLNTPGYTPSAATLLDGFPMARQGRGGEALGISATASALGAICGILVLAASIPVMIQLVLLFGPPEIFWLGIWGIVVVAAVIGNRVITGVISAALGLMFAMYGVSGVTAGVRWTFGVPSLLNGIPVLPALIGLFAIAEMVNLSVKGEAIDQTEEIEIGGGRLQGIKDVFIHRWVFLRSALIGTVIGIIPGVGGTAANYVAYFQAVALADDPESFGTGDPRGVVASEASNDAKEGGAYIPTLGFGIPGSASMAVLLGAFLLHGITPGPLLIQDHLDVVAIIVLSALVSNIVSSGLLIALAERLIAITRVDIRVVAPVVFAFSFFAAYADSNNVFFVWVTLAFGILGYLMVLADVSRVPLILGLVLEPVIEHNFVRSLQISGGEYGIFVRSPITILLILLVVLSLLRPYVRPIVGRVRNAGGSG